MNDIDYMTSAYRLMYEIETVLKYNIHKAYSKDNGLDWERKLNVKSPIDTLLFRQILRMYRYDKKLQHTFDNLELYYLNQLRTIRNDIAHMNVITEEELRHLQMCHKLVVSRVREKAESS